MGVNGGMSGYSLRMRVPDVGIMVWLRIISKREGISTVCVYQTALLFPNMRIRDQIKDHVVYVWEVGRCLGGGSSGDSVIVCDPDGDPLPVIEYGSTEKHGLFRASPGCYVIVTQIDYSGKHVIVYCVNSRSTRGVYGQVYSSMNGVWSPHSPRILRDAIMAGEEKARCRGCSKIHYGRVDDVSTQLCGAALVIERRCRLTHSLRGVRI